jgi:hypothetical protein
MAIIAVEYDVQLERLHEPFGTRHIRKMGSITNNYSRYWTKQATLISLM